MKMLIVCVRDLVVGAFLPPFFVRSKGEALRSFQDAVSDPKHQFAQHLDDYELYALGAFDDSTGMVTGHPPEPWATARSLAM